MFGFCPKCGNWTQMTRHHIFPKRHYGNHHSKSILRLCRGCHDVLERDYIPFERQEHSFYSRIIKTFLGIGLWSIIIYGILNIFTWKLHLYFVKAVVCTPNTKKSCLTSNFVSFKRFALSANPRKNNQATSWKFLSIHLPIWDKFFIMNTEKVHYCPDCRKFTKHRLVHIIKGTIVLDVLECLKCVIKNNTLDSSTAFCDDFLFPFS